MSVLPESPPQRDPERLAAGEQLGRAFKGAMAAVRRLRGRESHAAPGELGDAQYGVLFCLLHGGEMAAGEVALAADLSAASATEMLEGLSRAGLVERTRSARDRRVVLNVLTARGRQLVEQRKASYEPRFAAAMAEFTSEELRTAAAVLERLRAMFDELAEERGRR